MVDLRAPGPKRDHLEWSRPHDPLVRTTRLRRSTDQNRQQRTAFTIPNEPPLTRPVLRSRPSRRTDSTSISTSCSPLSNTTPRLLPTAASYPACLNRKWRIGPARRWKYFPPPDYTGLFRGPCPFANFDLSLPRTAFCRTSHALSRYQGIF